jgi:hypothetical protein
MKWRSFPCAQRDETLQTRVQQQQQHVLYTRRISLKSQFDRATFQTNSRDVISADLIAFALNQ